MRSWTYLEMKDKVENDLDLQDEILITDDEMLGYANEGIDEAESEILTTYEGYFKTSQILELVDGQQDYDLPEDIYAHKIIGLIYDDGSDKYEIHKLRDHQLGEIPLIESDDDFRFMIVNSEEDGPKLRLYPTPSADDTTSVTLWYIRNARRLVDDQDECDIPEFSQFVIQFMKVQCLAKEFDPRTEKAEKDLEKLRQRMIDTLEEMTPNGDNQIPMDLSIYEEMS